jgi:hypothetical protein
MDDGRGIQPPSAAQKDSALKQAHIGLCVQTVTALCAMRRNEAQSLPRAQGGRGNAHAARYLADAQEAAGRSICRWRGEILSA